MKLIGDTMRCYRVLQKFVPIFFFFALTSTVTKTRSVIPYSFYIE